MKPKPIVCDEETNLSSGAFPASSYRVLAAVSSRFFRLEPILLPIFFVFSAVMLTALLFVSAWQSDDAFISWRAAENAATGYGLRWNVDERVQAFSNPLWTLSGLGIRLITGEFYYSMIVVSMGLTLAAGVLLFRLTRSTPYLFLAILWGWMSSNAFIDFSVSGLEPPLLAFLIVCTAAAIRSNRDFVGLLLTGLLSTVRPDALLSVLPMTVFLLLKNRNRPKIFFYFVLTWSPFILWELFSLIYYGSFVPNTAWAKLNVSIPRTEILLRGLQYVQNSLRNDPATLVLTVAASAAAWRSRKPEARALAAGAWLYIGYVIWIGGDFMSGRFWFPSFVQSWAALAVSGRDSKTGGSITYGIAFTLLFLFCALWPGSRLRTYYVESNKIAVRQINTAEGVVDERQIYYPFTGLLRVLESRDAIRKESLPTPPVYGAVDGSAFKNTDERVAERAMVGFFGFFAGPDKIIVDSWALSDPLLARIPFEPDGAWRIGHYRRSMPKGYMASRRDGKNHLVDPGLRDAYDDLLLITRGPLWTVSRWRAIWRMHTGYHESAFAGAADSQRGAVE